LNVREVVEPCGRDRKKLQFEPRDWILWLPSTAFHLMVSPATIERDFGLQTNDEPLETARTRDVSALADPTGPSTMNRERAQMAHVREKTFRRRSTQEVRTHGQVGLRDVRSDGYSAPMTDESRSPALQEAAKRRRTLHEALVGLEFAISSPASGRIPEWTRLVAKEVTAVRDAWDQHVDTTEKPGGLYEEIVTTSPRLVGTVDRLRHEHPDITDAVGLMVERVETVEIGGLEWPLDDARDDLQRFIGKVIRHRQKGADLVWEAYNVDIGGPE
jgi:hypothetical protein